MSRPPTSPMAALTRFQRRVSAVRERHQAAQAAGISATASGSTGCGLTAARCKAVPAHDPARNSRRRGIAWSKYAVRDGDSSWRTRQCWLRHPMSGFRPKAAAQGFKLERDLSFI
jgi:hypothetical protein